MKKVCPPLPREVLRLRCLPRSRRKEVSTLADCYFTNSLLTILLYTNPDLLEGLWRKLHFFSHKLQFPRLRCKAEAGGREVI